MKKLLCLGAFALVAAACDEVADELGAGPQQSYCEALCVKAIACNAEERTIDEAALDAACRTETHAANPGCADAESDPGLDPASSEALASCTDAVADLGCDGFTGRLDALVQALPPTACGTEGEAARATFEAARHATFEGNDELCDRRMATFCGRLTECLAAEFGTGGIPEDAIAAIGFEPNARCLEANQGLTDSCKADQLYAPEASLVDPQEANTARQAARECVKGLGTVACDPLLGGQVPELCAGAFTSTEESASLATSLAEIAQPFVEEAARRNGG